MAAVGNLNDFVKYQMAQGMETGGASTGAVGAEMAVGFAIAQQMMQQAGGIMAQGTAPAGGTGVAAGQPSAAAPQIPELVGPAEAATLLGVAESDVIASLEAGDLKGRRIGTQWRISRPAIAEFLR
jgi:excisionase family DNA binding protein